MASPDPEPSGSDDGQGARPTAAVLRFKARVDALVSAAEWVLGLVFGVLVLTVGFQVLARNVFSIPAIWTPELAQLLFAWLILLGSGFAFRRNAHYTVDFFPPSWTRLGAVLSALSVIAALIVSYLMIRYGLVMVELRGRAPIEALGISRAWVYWPFPVLGALILAFTVEKGVYRLAGVPQ